MVILGYRTGQLGNRLFQYGHWLGNSWEYKYTLYNPSFDEYGGYFNRNAENSIYEVKKTFLSFWIVRKTVLLIAKVVFKYMYLRQKNVVGNHWVRFYRIRDDEECDLGSHGGVRLRESTKYLVVQGWLYRDNVSWNRKMEQIREFFALA